MRLNRSFFHAMKKFKLKVQTISPQEKKPDDVSAFNKNRKGVSRLSFLKRPRPFLQNYPKQVGSFLTHLGKSTQTQISNESINLDLKVLQGTFLHSHC